MWDKVRVDQPEALEYWACFPAGCPQKYLIVTFAGTKPLIAQFWLN